MSDMVTWIICGGIIAIVILLGFLVVCIGSLGSYLEDLRHQNYRMLTELEHIRASIAGIKPD